nr:MAG TPA: minor capsid protein [Caudoviricetes sp.]
MFDIVRRIKKTGEITSTADWQINRLRILGYSSEDIENMIKDTLNKSYPQMFELYDNVIDWEYVRNKDIYEKVNAEFIPFEENGELQQITYALARQSCENLENVTQSLGFYLDYGNGNRVMTPLSQVYSKYLDAACFDIVSGAFDYNSVLRRVVTQLTNSGLRQIDYASGYSSRVEVAARRAVMTGISQLTGKISEINAEKLGTEHFEVAWHSGARPTHAVWQGKVWTKEQLTTVCGLGSVTGILGANCYHEYYPFIPGISDRNWTDDWLEAQERKENTPKEFRGKEYTVYEAKQRQRQMETAMRAQRQKVKLFQDNGADPDEVMLARAKYQGQLDEYARFSKKMGLQQERERIYLDMQGRVAPRGRKYGQYILAKEKENSIIKSELREIGLKGKINMRPCKLDISKATFDDNHINRERNHNVTLEEAKSYIENAQFSETVWKGRFERYYSYDGVTYVNRNNLQIRTAYKPEQFSKTVQKVMEVLKNHGRQ